MRDARLAEGPRRALPLGGVVLATALAVALVLPSGARTAPASVAPQLSGGLAAPGVDPPGGVSGPTGATGATGVTGASGGGPQVSTDLPCYLPGRVVQLNGTGFPASTPYAVTLDENGDGFGHVSSTGSLSGTLTSPALGAGATQATHQLMVLSPGVTGSTQFAVTQFGASFAPTTGDPRTLLVHYSVYGFGLGPALPTTGQPAPTGVYLHYIGPHGTPIRNAQIGITSGPCGSLPLSHLHHLFGFVPTAGTWHLQFDTQRHYSATSVPRVVHVVTVR